MDYFVKKNIRVPQSLDGTFFKLVSHEVNDSDYNIKASCVLCHDEKKEKRILSGSLKYTTNFRLHIKVGI
jgi:hypothetical protein